MLKTYSNLAQSVRSPSSMKPSQSLSTRILNLLRAESHVENILKSCSVCTFPLVYKTITIIVNMRTKST